MRHLATLLASSLVLLACGGGGESGPGNDSGGSQTLSASFLPDLASPGPGTVALTAGAATGNLVTVNVAVAGVNDVYSAGVDVVYDDSVVDYVSWSRGTLLEAGGHSPLYSIGAQPGQVVVGVSRSGPVGGVDVVGPSTLIKLTFRVTAAGSSTVSVANGALLDGGPPAPTPIAGLTWHGGSLQAN